VKYCGLVTHRRSVAKRGGCFPRTATSVWVFVCLFVCSFVCPHDNVRRSNLTVRYTVQKSLPSSKVKIKGQCHQGQKRKTAESSPLTMHSMACDVARPYAARSNRRYYCVPPGSDGLRRWENQRMLSSCTTVRFVVYVVDLLYTCCSRRLVLQHLDMSRRCALL